MLELRSKPAADALAIFSSERARVFKTKKNRAPKLVVILVGDDPASVIYTQKKGEAATKLGIDHETIRFPSTATALEVRSTLERLNTDPHVDGILIQRPLPNNFSESNVVYWVHPSKDVDAFHPENIGRLSLGLRCLTACTPNGVIHLLEYFKTQITGKVACVVGRSAIVGKPMAQLLLQKNATLIQTHSQTKNLKALTSIADILIVAAGKPKLIDHSYIKPGATVVDVGIHRMTNGSLCGDCDFDSVKKTAGALTPVPGGIGPMTIAMLMQNTLEAAYSREGLKWEP